MADWAVVISKPSQERKAFDQLTKRGFQCFLPFIMYHRKQEPMFPRYLFVVVQDTWHGILSTIGVADVIRCDKKPVVIGDHIVEGIRLRCGPTGIFVKERFRIGSVVEVGSGAFAGQLVEISRIGGHRRVEALMALLGSKVKVEFDEDDLIAA